MFKRSNTTTQIVIFILGRSIMFELLIVCGGTSSECDISLNSARSVYDNIGASEHLHTRILFIDKEANKHLISSTFLYSNTVSDFDFKLAQSGVQLTEEEYIEELQKSDLVFPVIHGEYGEDGKIQKLLSELGVPFVGSNYYACNMMYNKRNADNQLLRANGFYTIPRLYLEYGYSGSFTKLERFFQEYHMKSAIAKPVCGGSSVGVEFLESLKYAKEQIEKLLKKYKHILVEPICDGKEFTVIILQNKEGKPVALYPTEIQIENTDNAIFNKRRKYLSTTETHYYCPARFDSDIIEKIRRNAEALFNIVGASDFLRIDGWLLKDGHLYFSDFNPISGMEQNSFLFQQAAKVGFTHKALLEYIMSVSCKRQLHGFPSLKTQDIEKKRVNVLMGGWTSERQVSLMSGTNVWLKLMNSKKYDPVPYLLVDKDTIYEIPYAIALNHTIEEMKCQLGVEINHDVESVRKRLGLSMDECCSITNKPFITLNEFINESKNNYVFIGLHGGFGENGELQAEFEKAGLMFSGTGSVGSFLCMDKYKTGELVMGIGKQKLRTAKKIIVDVDEDVEFDFSKKVVAKPNDDGCSTGVVILESREMFDKYRKMVKVGGVAPQNTFYKQSERITMSKCDKFLLEEYIEVDDIKIRNKELYHEPKYGWLELTVGVTENSGKYKSFEPSITVAENSVLSLEEKFQGGTGVNITPPPEEIITKEFREKIKEYMELVAEAAKVRDYCRIDIFANSKTCEVIVIEINTLPGLSPSTVLFQQASAANKTPLEFLESVIESKLVLT